MFCYFGSSGLDDLIYYTEVWRAIKTTVSIQNLGVTSNLAPGLLHRRDPEDLFFFQFQNILNSYKLHPGVHE